MKEKTNNKQKKKVKKTKIKQNIPKIMFRAFLLLLTLALIVFGTYGIYFSFTSPNFNVSKVEVKGNSKYTSAEILGKAKVEIGKNINRVSKMKINSNLKDMVYIDSINIDRKYPNKIVINIKERISKYAAHSKDKNIYYKITKDGYILEEVTPTAISNDETILFGINFADKIKYGTKLESTELSKLETLDKIMSKYTLTGIKNKVTSISFEKGTYMLTLDYKTDIIVDISGNMEYKMSFLKEILDEIGTLPGVIDMTKPNPYFSQRAS